MAAAPRLSKIQSHRDERALTTVLLPQLDAGSLQAVDGADVNAVSPDHLYVLSDCAATRHVPSPAFTLLQASRDPAFELLMADQPYRRGFLLGFATRVGPDPALPRHAPIVQRFRTHAAPGSGHRRVRSLSAAVSHRRPRE